MANGYFNQVLIVIEIICFKKAIPLSEYNSRTHLIQQGKNHLVILSVHFKMSTVARKLKIASSL